MKKILTTIALYSCFVGAQLPEVTAQQGPGFCDSVDRILAATPTELRRLIRGPLEPACVKFAVRRALNHGDYTSATLAANRDDVDFCSDARMIEWLESSAERGISSARSLLAETIRRCTSE